MAGIIVVLAALFRLASVLPVEAGLQLAADKQRFAAASDSATMEAIRALDTDHSGKVDKAEIEAFAGSQGLSVEEVRAEFADLDTNHNGELEAEEITNTLNQASPSVVAKVPDAARLPKVSKEAEPKAAAIVLSALAVEKTASETSSSSAKSSSASLQLQALELDAQQHAGKALAEVFARTAAKALESRSEDNDKASKLEQAARALRSQVADLKKRAAAETVNAATAAAAAVLKSASEKVKLLEQQASEAEMQATNKRAEAKEAMNKALHARSEMSTLPVVTESV